MTRKTRQQAWVREQRKLWQKMWLAGCFSDATRANRKTHARKTQRARLARLIRSTPFELEVRVLNLSFRPRFEVRFTPTFRLNSFGRAYDRH